MTSFLISSPVLHLSISHGSKSRDPLHGDLALLLHRLVVTGRHEKLPSSLQSRSSVLCPSSNLLISLTSNLYLSSHKFEQLSVGRDSRVKRLAEQQVLVAWRF
ncbi:hypothetical protein F2Q70_00016154 [Brassica cretica]|uniref:Uncharacterized protein n=1 Tax=Brassica cretica TaxID=69181 RepID=A0A8S9HUT2_BRACR|nr:hypothetical protein F2Q70_00016154 [Brassica cretica]KAF2595532.1 hypothetical protein F2Q68_00009143 [Brassica cretica]